MHGAITFKDMSYVTALNCRYDYTLGRAKVSFSVNWKFCSKSVTSNKCTLLYLSVWESCRIQSDLGKTDLESELLMSKIYNASYFLEVNPVKWAFEAAWAVASKYSRHRCVNVEKAISEVSAIEYSKCRMNANPSSSAFLILLGRKIDIDNAVKWEWESEPWLSSSRNTETSA